MPLISIFTLELREDQALLDAVSIGDIKKVRACFPVLTSWLVGPSEVGIYRAFEKASSNGNEEIASFLLSKGAANELINLSQLEFFFWASIKKDQDKPTVSVGKEEDKSLASVGKAQDKPTVSVGKDENKPSISDSLVITIINACFNNPKFLNAKKFDEHYGFKYKDAVSLLITLLERYSPQSKVVVETLNLCEKYLIELYQHDRKYALDFLNSNGRSMKKIGYHPHDFYVKEKNSEEIKKGVFLKFFIDAYDRLGIYPISDDKKDHQKIASRLFCMMPDLDIFNIIHLDDDNKEHNKGILSLIRGRLVPIVKALLSCNRAKLNFEQKTQLLEACLTKYSDVVQDNNPCLAIVIQHLKPTDPAVQHFLKEYVIENNEHQAAKLLSCVGIFCHFPDWKETVQKSTLSDSLKEKFVSAEEKRNSYSALLNMAATCKPIRDLALTATPKNYGSKINFKDYGQLAFFALFHDIQNTCPEVVDQYQAMAKTSTI